VKALLDWDLALEMALIQQKLNEFAEDSDEQSEEYSIDDFDGDEFVGDENIGLEGSSGTAGLPRDLAHQKKIEQGLLRRLGTLVAHEYHGQSLEGAEAPIGLIDFARIELNERHRGAGASSSPSAQTLQQPRGHQDSQRSISFEPSAAGGTRSNI